VPQRIVLALIALFLFHAAHRIYHSLHDIGVHAGTGAMAAIYGAALTGSALTVVLLATVGF
jgi:fumarate reductase subunit D